MRWVALAAVVIAGVMLSDVWFDVDYRLAANISLVVIAVVVSVFTAMYGLRSNWRSNRIGTVFLVKGVTLSLVLWQAVMSVWGSEEYLFRHQIRFVIYALGAVAYAAMVVTLWREQHRDRATMRSALHSRYEDGPNL